MYYAGIGSRRTPPLVLEQMIQIAEQLGEAGWTLRSGGADGADSAFEKGCDTAGGKKEIFLPWRGFNGSKSQLYTVSADALAIAQEFHPAWYRLSQGARKLMGRNACQVLGQDLQTPADLIICWAKTSGGTSQALRIAEHHGIPVVNMIRKGWRDELKNFLEYNRVSIQPQ